MSTTGYDHQAPQQLLGTVGQAMTTPVLVLDADTPADVAARRLERSGVSGAPVLDRGRVVGVITLADLLARPMPGLPVPQISGPFLRHEHLLASLQVWQLMTVEPIVVAADQPLLDAALLMDQHQVNRLPVVDEQGRPVGIIARDDVIRALARHARAHPATTDRAEPRRVPQTVPD
ncbi:MAG TPA: CBS domain-containing protein [Actinomycetes bacterium]|jgi:CBS domain-containing protein|nr:CBS domain-containing protein [Actinomycetes bacterium]